MTITKTPPRPRNKHHSQPEAIIQAACVKWLWNNYPETRGNFIHIPNEGNRSSAIDGSLRKALGLVAGAPDTFLFMARNGYHGLAIEFKSLDGKQREEQVAFQKRLEENGYLYKLCRSEEQFHSIIEDYFSKK